MTAWRERGACRCAPRSARKKFADYARRRDPRAGLGRGVRPSPISTERGGRRREPQLTPAGRRCSGRREAPYSDREAAKRDRGPSKVAVMPLLALVIIVLGAGLAAVAPLYLRLVRRELSRADRMERAARMLGLQFSRGDPAYPGSIGQAFPFELFSRGIEQTCENVMTGTLGGVPVTALDFLYVQQVDSGTRHPDGTADYRALRSEPARYACAVGAIGGHRPHVVIEPASMLPEVHVAPERVQLEWGDFNARYRVSSPERGFATALLDVDLMAWLVDLAPHLSLTWEVQRGDVLCRTHGLEPERLPELVGALVEFATRIGPGASA